MSLQSRLTDVIKQIATDIKSLRANTHAKGQDLNINNKALIFSDAGGTTNNIDHVWHDETNNAMHLCSDTTLRALGNSTVCSGSSAFLGNVIELNHIAERFDKASHGRLWRIVTGIRKSDTHMFQIRLSGYGFAPSALYDFTIGGYAYLNARLLNTVALSRGTHHCDFVWLGFDASNRLNIFLGHGLPKYYSGVTLDVKLHHGGGARALSDAQLVNQANWQILDSPTGTPADTTTWSGITDIVKVAVVKQ